MPHASAAPVVDQHEDALAGKVIADIANTFNSNATGLSTSACASIAQEIAKALPAGAQVVKAFNCQSCRMLRRFRRAV